jgi:hypothetical protein
MSPPEPVKRRKFLGETTYTLEKPLQNKIDREKVKARILIEASRRVTIRAKRGDARRFKGRSPDFEKLEFNADSAISFEPGSAIRHRLVALLQKPESDLNRKRLMEKLCVEMSRIYTRYRRDVERQLGQQPNFAVAGVEKTYAGEAAMWCLVKGVTPRQLLEYWHNNIGNFAGLNLKFPPLSLLKSPGMVDQVACATIDPKRPMLENKTEDGRPKSKNSYNDVNVLNKAFRPAAKKAGFDVSEFSDRYLVTLQKMAISIAQGERVFIGAKVKGLVTWAAENLYANTP